MSDRMTRLGVGLRPHVKTHKCTQVARLQVRGHDGGITVSTLAEAHAFSDAGFDDITYAYPLPTSRMAELLDLRRRTKRLNLVLDQESALDALEKGGERFRVFLEVDSGDHRCGVNPEKKESLALAARIAGSPVVEFRGLLTHGGHSYACRTSKEIEIIAAEERDSVVRFAERLRAGGIEVPEVSVGSTPTMRHVDHLEGVTEARPGNYAFFDAFQAAIGSCSLQDVAFSVLTRVVARYPDQNRMIVDAGALALSKDPGPTHIDPECGYGVVCTPGGASLPGLKVTSLSQEHGQVHATQPIDWEEFPVGTLFGIIPNHSCLTTALHHRFHVFERGQLTESWNPVRGW